MKNSRFRALRSSTLSALAVMLLGSAAPLSAQTPPAAAAHTFAIDDKEFLLDGKPLVIRCGEIHFARVPREYWRHRLQMAKAMGLNTVCVYLFWNFHEWEEGKFDWQGQADVAEFCRLAQQEGLWVLLRPGPYSCAEWEMGGLPWWLLKHDGIQLRTKDPAFLTPAVRYLKEVGRVLAPLQINHGGPLLMVQVENEYGSFGKDAEYMGALRQALLDGGFDVPLFACNPPSAIANGYRPDLFQVVNFGAGGGAKSFETLRHFQKTGPLMNGEYYPAWFDQWGRSHKTGAVEPYLADLEHMLKDGHSFSIYMAHGGTSFGLWSGADRPFTPDTSSYDYDAPISEAGWVTDKFTKTRELFAKYLLPGETLPAPPAANPVIAVEPFALTETAPVLENLPVPQTDKEPRTMEFYGQSRGCTLYRTTLPPGPAGALQVKELHDFAWIFLDGKQIGVMDRRGKRYGVELPERGASARLDILVEAVGRVNFGKEVFDRKGVYGPVQLLPHGGGSAAQVPLLGDVPVSHLARTSVSTLENWQVFPLPLDNGELATLKYTPVNAADAPAHRPAFWRGHFQANQVGDTFLDVRTLGKGVLWVNGHCLGRFWNIGPTQTMYCPGPWLKPGSNEVVVLDLLGPATPKLAGLTKPILDELHLEKDFARRVRASGKLEVGGLTPAAEGAFKADIQWQDVHFHQSAHGRYLCLEALSSTDGKPFAAVAELDALDEKGEVLSKANWKILGVDSEELTSEPGDAENVLDGQPATHWHTAYAQGPTPYPHWLVIDLGGNETVAGVRYLPRSGNSGEPGRVKDYRVYVADKPFGLVPQIY